MSNLHPFVPRPTKRRPRFPLPSLNFLLLAAIFTGTGALMWHGLVAGRFFVFVFVISGWVVSLCLHEFGHAVTALVGGDEGIRTSGYLDLDPTRYADPLLSIVLPLVFILLGGIGLPGGAVFINPGRLRGRGWSAAVAAAGISVNALFMLGLAALYPFTLSADGGLDLAAAVAVLAFFQATAVLINILPLPGLDGFGIIRPFLSPQVAAKAAQIGTVAFLILFALLWLTSAGAYLIRAGVAATSALGIDNAAVAFGFGQIKLF